MTIRRGVIIGVQPGLMREQVDNIIELLEARYPGVVFMIVGGMADSLAFTFDDEASG